MRWAILACVLFWSGVAVLLWPDPPRPARAVPYCQDPVGWGPHEAEETFHPCAEDNAWPT